MRVGMPQDLLLPGAGQPATTANNQQKGVAAAKDFEALLIGQMLRSAREEGSGWLGTDDDDAGSTAYSLGEDQLAKAMAAGGGLGLSKVIAAGTCTAGDARRPRSSRERVRRSRRHLVEVRVAAILQFRVADLIRDLQPVLSPRPTILPQGSSAA